MTKLKVQKKVLPLLRRCEERSDEAISGAEGLPRTPTCHCEEPSSFVIARSAATKQSRGKAIATHPAGPRNDTMRKDENMKRIRLSNKTRKALQGHSGGFTLIEVLIALALFAIIAIVFAGGLSTASKAVLTADVRTRAESLARTQMEFIKEQGYGSTYSKISIPGVTDGSGSYLICSCNGTSPVAVNCTSTDRIIAVAWDSTTNNATTSETGLQKITLVIKHDDIEVTRLEGYKVDR